MADHDFSFVVTGTAPAVDQEERDRIHCELIDALNAAYGRWKAGDGSEAEHREALRRLNRFIAGQPGDGRPFAGL